MGMLYEPGRAYVHLRPFIALILLVLPYNALAASDTDLEKDLQSSLTESRTIVDKIEGNEKAGLSISTEIGRLKTLSEGIRASHLLMGERLRLRKEKVKSLGVKAIERQQNVYDGYKKAIEEYLWLIDSLQPSAISDQQNTLKQIKTLLNKIIVKKKRPIHGTLPYKNLNYPAREPSSAASITPAYKGGNKTIAPEDTQGTEEAPISLEIASLAQTLNWQPVAIYEYVKNSMETEWYYGCMKGAEETLRQKSGNDCDQATLLVSLMRASGFPSRYVRGSMEFFAGGRDGKPIERAKNLLGINDPVKIAEYLQKAGIPYKPVISGGQIANFEIEHIWVESLIPYSNYRGIVIDDMGKTWLGLDTSIKVKEYVYNSPQDVFSGQWQVVGGQFTGLRDEYLTTPAAATPLEYLKSRINSELTTQNSQFSYNDFLRNRTLPEEHLGILPARIQHTLIKATNEYNSIPDELIHKVRFTATDTSNNELFTITLPSYKLSNQKIAISYEPETVEDQEIIDSYGGLDNTPSYLVRLRPVLKIYGERVVVGKDGLPMGSDYNLSVELISPNGTEKTSSSQIVGNLAVIGIVAGKANAPSLPLFTKVGDETAEEILYKEAINYIDRWNKAEDELASLLHLAYTRPVPAVITVGGIIDVTYLLDMPHGFEWKGLFMDASIRRIETVGAYGNTPKLFMQLSALQGSVLEHRVFEDDLKVESISTAKLLQLSGQGSVVGGQIVTIDKTNITSILPTLPFDDNIKEDIANSVNQNLTIRIPQFEITHQNWSGIGYIKENSTTGEAGYMLSGIIAGGMTAWNLEKWPVYYAERLINPYSEPPNYDPSAAVNIHKITKTDLQEGIVGEKLEKPFQVIVFDKNMKPVKDVEVTFTVKAGGGTLSGKDANNQTITGTSITVPTNSLGIASFSLTLGQETKSNPTFWWEEGYTHSQQVGENIVDAALTSGTGIATPFSSFGFPKIDQNVQIKQTHGDGKWASILSFAGFVSASIEDKYGNPISNIPMDFQAQGAEIHLTSTCTNLNGDIRATELVKTADPCIDNIPTIEQCATRSSAITDITSENGAAVQVILGATPDAKHPVKAKAAVLITSGTSPSTKILETTFNLNTYPFGNCDGKTAPANQLILKTIYTADQYGNNINAGRTGTTIPIQAGMTYLREKEAKKEMTHTCDTNTVPCDTIIGERSYYPDANLKPGKSSVTFDNQAGTLQGNGIYTGTYTLKPGKNNIPIKGTGVIDRNLTSPCSSCATITQEFSQTSEMTMTVYGVDIIVNPIPVIMVDETERTGKDYTITYTITPAEYKATSAYVMIYKTGETDPVAYIPAETQGTGTATISRGFYFDISKAYEAEVILNYGTGVEIKSGKVPLKITMAALIPDFDHNRVMDQMDKQRAVLGDTYYFWINDDDDSGETGGTDIPGQTQASDSETFAVDGIRDLIDFFPVFLNLKNVMNIYPPDTYTYKLKSESENLNFAFTDIEPAHAGEYLTGNGTGIEPASTLENAPTYLVTKDGVPLNNLNPAFLQKIRDNGKGIILLEGVKQGNAPLVLEISDTTGKTVQDARLNISIDSIENMFRHKNLMEAGGGPAPNSWFADGGVPDRLTEPSNYPDKETNGKNFVFVHGYNVSGQQARGAQAEIFKRMYWSGSKAKFWGISWYGSDTQEVLGLSMPATRNYHINVRHAFATARPFAYFLNNEVGGEITIAAHSLGNMVVSSALSDHGAISKNYLMIDAAVAMEAYDGGTVPEKDGDHLFMENPDWNGYSPYLWASEWYTRFTVDDARNKLTWRDRFKNRPTGTTYYNFYSTGEEVLGKMPYAVSSWDGFIEMLKETGQNAWALQERLKGRLPLGWVLGSTYGGWGFNLDDYNTVDTFPDGTTITKPLLPSEANYIMPENLKAKPFFKKGNQDNDLYTPYFLDASHIDYDRRAQLLAEAFPALTLPAGANFTEKFTVNNFDMQAMQVKVNSVVQWPVERDTTQWKHSDIKNVAYVYIFKLFDELIGKGELK